MACCIRRLQASFASKSQDSSYDLRPTSIFLYQKKMTKKKQARRNKKPKQTERISEDATNEEPKDLSLLFDALKKQRQEFTHYIIGCSTAI